jgi:hypothetical protein
MDQQNTIGKWYTITPTAPINIGNLTPVGQNSGQVGCRWPPNGHHLAACLQIPTHCQIWGPFWGYNRELYLTLPQTVYTTDVDRDKDQKPNHIYRLQWRSGQWQVRSEHENEEIELIGGRYLIAATYLDSFWQYGQETERVIEQNPWQTLTLSHNSREEYQVKEEGGFFAEMVTELKPGWTILVKVIGDYTPPRGGILGAGGTPVILTPHRNYPHFDNLGRDNQEANGAVLLTGALWQKQEYGHLVSISQPYPPVELAGYAADLGVPWQSWKSVKNRHNPNQRIQVLTPGEWLTPAGAVYIGERGVLGTKSGPWSDRFNRHALGYGHLWLFTEKN